MGGSVKLMLIKKYGEELGSIKWEEIKQRKKGIGSLKHYIEKYGDILGKEQYYAKNKKLSVSVKSLKLNGFSDDEILRIRKKHAEKSAITIENCIERHGLENGIKKYKQWKEKEKIGSKRCIDYWINKCDGDIEQAKEKLKCYQRRDLKFFIDLYGEINGTEKFYKFRKGANKGLLQNGKYSFSQGQIEVEQFLSNVYPNIKIFGHKNNYAIFLNKQEQLLLNNKKALYPDIIVLNYKIIIEYFGDFWHGGASIFNDENIVHPYLNQSIQDIRKKDELRLNIFRNRGFCPIVIWEHEWKQSQDVIKKKLVEAFDENYQKRNIA